MSPAGGAIIKMIYLREANGIGDCVLVYSWHNNPLIFSGFYTIREPFSFEEHRYWWEVTTKSWRKFMVILLENEVERPIGLIRISGLEDFSPQIAFTIGEVSLWGQRYGSRAVSLTLDWLKEHGYKHTHTSVLRSNERAINLLKGLGFNEYGEARENEIWIQRKL